VEQDKVEFNSVQFQGYLMNYQCHKPPARTLFSMTKCDKKLYIFGGILTEKFNDLWYIDLKGNITLISDPRKWYCIEPKGEIPSPRFGHTTVHFKKHLIIFGGKINTDQTLFREVYFYDIG
jgi:hypothetical protein